MSYQTLVMTLFTPIWAAIVHALLLRHPVAAKYPKQRLAFVACLITVTIVCYCGLLLDTLYSDTPSVTGIFTCVLSALLVHIYFHIFNMSETARRVRILVDVKQGKMGHGQRRDNDEMIEVRLKRLEDLGQVERWDGRYFSKATLFRFLCRVVRWHERLLFPKR